MRYMKKLLPLVMLLMTASAANAGGLVTRHQSSLQHTVDPTRTITSRTANSFAVSGSGVTMDGDGGSPQADLVVGGFGTLTNGAAAGDSQLHIKQLLVRHSLTVVLLPQVMLTMGLEL